ncbi:hypothetical protein Desti_5574 [Desulfomonile tiedjei DSM 6799]|uniref:Uncharacterized protein n=1 Tax=Desulfomonile tiedjei (strain ATCC 49306 / DSM 6799 / DCB-1) TaxID=706587 RepID=I4CBT2_DESTA|nr:hypothetical protein Desti_4391 [Desulfomonile tiedjei DSM 6799]AFM28155.1 hypothetical protein Desti_5574 [Desulfomonile tiedjei DSM 6799]
MDWGLPRRDFLGPFCAASLFPKLNKYPETGEEETITPPGFSKIAGKSYPLLIRAIHDN